MAARRPSRHGLASGHAASAIEVTSGQSLMMDVIRRDHRLAGIDDIPGVRTALSIIRARPSALPL